jgi:hypothetical protein
MKWGLTFIVAMGGLGGMHILGDLYEAGCLKSNISASCSGWGRGGLTKQALQGPRQYAPGMKWGLTFIVAMGGLVVPLSSGVLFLEQNITTEEILYERVPNHEAQFLAWFRVLHWYYLPRG